MIQQRVGVLLLDVFQTGELATGAKRNYFTNFFTGYNRTDVQERVQDGGKAAVFFHVTSIITNRDAMQGVWARAWARRVWNPARDCRSRDVQAISAALIPVLVTGIQPPRVCAVNDSYA